jgi:hypothetical protein
MLRHIWESGSAGRADTQSSKGLCQSGECQQNTINIHTAVVLSAKQVKGSLSSGDVCGVALAEEKFRSCMQYKVEDSMLAHPEQATG